MGDLAALGHFYGCVLLLVDVATSQITHSLNLLRDKLLQLEVISNTAPESTFIRKQLFLLLQSARLDVQLYAS